MVSFSGAPCTQQARDTRPHWYPTVRLWSQDRPCSLAAFPSRQQSQHIYRIHNTSRKEREKKQQHWLGFSRASGSMRLVFQPKIYSDWLKMLIAEILWLNNMGFCTDKYKRQALCLCGRQKGRLFARSQLTDRQREGRISVKKTNWQLLVDVTPSGIRVVVNQSSRQAAGLGMKGAESQRVGV